jgi:hypothetical protein
MKFSPVSRFFGSIKTNGKTQKLSSKHVLEKIKISADCEKAEFLSFSVSFDCWPAKKICKLEKILCKRQPDPRNC